MLFDVSSNDCTSKYDDHFVIVKSSFCCLLYLIIFLFFSSFDCVLTSRRLRVFLGPWFQIQLFYSCFLSWTLPTLESLEEPLARLDVALLSMLLVVVSLGFDPLMYDRM